MHRVHSAFRRNRQYIFRYEAQLMTGTPMASKLWSGLLLTANINLFFITDTRITAKVKPLLNWANFFFANLVRELKKSFENVFRS